MLCTPLAPFLSNAGLWREVLVFSMNIVLINIDKEAPARHLLTTIVHQWCWDEVQECFWQTHFSALLGLIVSTEGRRGSIRLPGADNQGSSERAEILMALHRRMDGPPHSSIDSLYCTDHGCLEQIIQMCVVCMKCGECSSC